MTSFARYAACLASLGAALMLAPQARAANASAPYTNVDHSNDAGNNTGNSQVGKLNSAQLDKNYDPAKQPPVSGGNTAAAPAAAPKP
jgi:hypothetical protein